MRIPWPLLTPRPSDLQLWPPEAGKGFFKAQRSRVRSKNSFNLRKILICYGPLFLCVRVSVYLCVGRGCPVELACLIKLKYFGKPRNSFASWFSYSHSADADRRLSVPAGSRVGGGSGVRARGIEAQSSMGPCGCGLLWSRFGFTLKNFTPGKLQTQQKFIKFRSQKKGEAHRKR